MGKINTYSKSQRVAYLDRNAYLTRADHYDKFIHTYPNRWHSGMNKPFPDKWNETVEKNASSLSMII